MLSDFDEKYFFVTGADGRVRDCQIFYPSVPSNGKLMLKPQYTGAFPYFEEEMLKRGYTLCAMSHPTRWGPDSETEETAKFVRLVAEELKMEPKCIVIGMSCGGLQAVRLAELHPELVSVLFLDAPVMNLLSMAGLGACNPTHATGFWNELVKTYGFNKSTILNFRKSPIDNMEPLIENNIPIIMLYGDKDDVVPYEENGQVLEEFYRERGGDLCVMRMEGRGHHPHSLQDPTPIIEFVEAHLK